MSPGRPALAPQPVLAPGRRRPRTPATPAPSPPTAS